MATINLFQQYSQAENTITNNVLLMLSSLYEINPRYYEDYINGLIEENEFYKIIPEFNQQHNNKGEGFIDGHIRVQPSRIIIETKIEGQEWIEKLLKYTKSFSSDEIQLLFHLSSSHYDGKSISTIRKRLEANKSTKNAKFLSLTYKDLVQQLEALKNLYPYEPQLQRLYNHFEAYTQNMGLIPEQRHVLRAMACGQSYDLNIKYQFYFDLGTRGYRHFNYLGIYYDKAVHYIGELENILLADYNSDSGLTIYESTIPPTDEQKKRLIAGIKASVEEGWHISKNHRFFLLKNFTETYFEKESPGGLLRARYFYLEDEPGIKVPAIVGELGKELRKYKWK